jgi:hypothetical protein
VVARFSQRVGGRPPFTSGLNEASEKLRAAAWNLLHPILLPVDSGSGQYARYQANAATIWNHLHWTTDQISAYATEGRTTLKGQWFQCDWLAFFDLFEFCVQLVARSERNRHGDPEAWFLLVNQLLEQQGCAYRFISQELAPITNPLEMRAVELAAECAIGSVSTHITEALKQLPPSPNASPRNSVKESISAVEATLKHLTGKQSASLGKGLDAFEAKYGELHDSMRRGFEHLYAYTNQPEGIRHALVEGARDVTVDDARLMLIQCSAFSNYLISIAEAAKKREP